MTTMTAPDAVGDLRLDGRRALITGGAKGIGADIAARLAAAGARLVITGRDETALATTSEELAGRFSTEVCGVAVDLTDPDAPHELAGRAAAAFDGLDILINNAGISFPESVVDVDADHFDATLTVNLRAPALLAAAVGRQMVEQGTGGSIVTVASAAALAPLPEHYAYCASKAGLVMATKVLA